MLCFTLFIVMSAATRVLDRLENKLNQKLKKQVQDGLAEVFSEVSCKGVGKEIKAGRRVTAQAEYGIRMCVHPKLGPRYNPTTKTFFPMTSKGKRLEEAFIEKTNQMLETGGFRKMNPKLLANLRKKDKEYEKRVKKR